MEANRLNLDDMLTVKDVARECDRTHETVRRWIREDKLPATKIGQVWYIDPRDLRNFKATVLERTSNQSGGEERASEIQS